MNPRDAVALVVTIPDRYARLLAGQDPTTRHPELEWTAGAYVSHVVDNLRIWAERLAGAARSGRPHVPGYDENLLARARSYDQIPVEGALWSLRHAATQWAEAVELATAADVVLRHDARGTQTAEDVARNNAHDAYHHEWDIRRTLGKR